LSAVHAGLAQKNLQNSKAKNLGEQFGRGYKRAEDLVDFSPYDMSKSPASRGELDNPRAKRSTATVQDMSNVVNHVAHKYGARVELVRSLGDNGFVCALVIQGGLYQGMTNPSVSHVEQELVHELRNVAPAAIVDLMTTDEVPTVAGPTARRLIFRFRLKGGDGRGITP
jgi:hypothetical protein